MQRQRRHHARSVRRTDIVRGALRKAGWINTATARRAHLDPAAVLILYSIPWPNQAFTEHSGALGCKPSYPAF